MKKNLNNPIYQSVTQVDPSSTQESENSQIKKKESSKNKFSNKKTFACIIMVIICILLCIVGFSSVVYYLSSTNTSIKNVTNASIENIGEFSRNNSVMQPIKMNYDKENNSMPVQHQKANILNSKLILNDTNTSFTNDTIIPLSKFSTQFTKSTESTTGSTTTFTSKLSAPKEGDNNSFINLIKRSPNKPQFNPKDLPRKCIHDCDVWMNTKVDGISTLTACSIKKNDNNNTSLSSNCETFSKDNPLTCVYDSKNSNSPTIKNCVLYSKKETFIMSCHCDGKRVRCPVYKK